MEAPYITFICLLVIILFRGIEQSTGARIGELTKRSTSAIPNQEELQNALMEKLPLLTTVISEQYQNHCLKKGIQVKSGEIEPALDMCIVEPIRRFVAKTFDALESSPPDVMQHTTNAGMKLYLRTQERNFHTLSVDEKNAFQKQVVGPICTFAVEILDCFQAEIQKGKIKCADWFERKTLEFINQQLSSVCFDNGNRIMQSLNVDMSKSKCIQKNQGYDYTTCDKNRGVPNEEPKTLQEFCHAVEVGAECLKDLLADCKEKDIVEITNPMIRESQAWAKSSCLMETTSSVETIHAPGILTGLILITLWANMQTH